MSYKKCELYMFKVDDEVFSLEHVRDNIWQLEEARKNGQEDEHFSAVLIDGGEVILTEEVNNGDYYDLDAIRAYIHKHGFPS